MKILTLIVKGILMYSTLLYWVFIICIADSLTFNGILMAFGLGFTSLYICKTFITLEDVAILTGNDPKEIENETV